MTSSKTDLKNNSTLKTVVPKTMTLKSGSFFDDPEDCDLKILLSFRCNIFLNFSLWTEIDVDL